MQYDCLIVDDEIELAESTAEYFNLFDVYTAYVTSAGECLRFLEQNTTGIILLDINLGEDSGFDLCKKLRNITDVPILFISAREGDDNQILALNIGGDDYIHKPYSLGVLLAKAKAILKRYQQVNIQKEDTYQVGNIRIEFNLGRVYVRDEEIPMKAMEYKLLTYLVKNRNRIITKDELFENVWEDMITADGTLNVHIRYLREKIEESPNEPKFIKTVWGRGYIFEDTRS